MEEQEKQQNNNGGLQIIGRIDLNQWVHNRIQPVKSSSCFKMLQMKLSFFGREALTIDFGDVDNEDHRYFSLFIGMNGVGKSTFLREIIDFFIDSQYGKSRRTDSQQVKILSLRYAMGGHEYEIVRNEKNKFYFTKDYVSVGKPEYPLIIASTMGMFDKFPINSTNPLRRKSRYDVPFYKYVGPKANNNMYASKTNVMLQMLAVLENVKRKAQLQKIGDILEYIGYDPVIKLNYSVKENYLEVLKSKDKYIDVAARSYLLDIGQQQMLTAHINPKTDTLKHIGNLHLREINQLRQEGLLTCKCTLSRDGKEIDCNLVSSGEFNMLSIIMSVVLSAGNQYLLVLLDKPEISQHPNWQISIIDKLDEALSDYACHFMVASHCHFLVSNLPQKRSNVFDIEYNEDNGIEINSIGSETYGWSAEQVLLEVFKVGTDRNKYLAGIIGDLMERIGNREILPAEVAEKLTFLQKVATNLSDIDPMKRVIYTILESFAADEAK